MADTLAHRGPDDRGSWVDPDSGVALGFRRLAIIDLTPEGRQPMKSASGRFVLIFNGEIYNHAELLRELGSAHREQLRGRSDTEVMLATIECWGLARALRRWVGMFAFALWDRAERALHLGRDRLGEKPLYYGRVGRALAFGSELKSLRAHPDFSAVIDRQALAQYMRFGYVPGPATIYEGVWKLPPAGILRVESPERPWPTPSAYWSAHQATVAGLESPFVGTEEEAAEALEAHLHEAVRGQMVADVPLGAFLSGGIDSSSIVALMHAQSDRPVKTFTIGFHEAAYNEAEHAKQVARFLGTDHTELYLTPSEALAVVPELDRIYDEPFADSSGIPMFLVSRLAVRDVTVSLSGDGGDELFAGYNWYPWAQKTWAYISRVPRAFRRSLAVALKGLSAESWDRTFRRIEPMLPVEASASLSGRRVHHLAALLLEAHDLKDVHRHSQSCWADPVVLGLDDPDPGPGGPSSKEATDPLDSDPIRCMTVQDMMSYLPDDILVKVDRASMAVGLETRAPFLDHRVVEFVATLPSSWKCGDGRSKKILRRVLYRHVPPGLVERPKAGFCVPIGEWLRGPLRDWGEDLLSERRLDREGFFDTEPIREAWRLHQAGGVELGQHLWNVLMFESWLHARTGHGG